MAVIVYRHKTWDRALAYANAEAVRSGYRYHVRRSPVGWWLVSRVPRGNVS
jgi:hypothetical protein